MINLRRSRKGGREDVLLLFSLVLVACVGCICCAGCIGGYTISNRAVVSELGLAMNLPANWYVDHDEPRMHMEAKSSAKRHRHPRLEPRTAP